jgi:DNA repair protein RadC
VEPHPTQDSGAAPGGTQGRRVAADRAEARRLAGASDAALLAALVCASPAERRATARAMRVGLRRVGLAAWARRSPAAWPEGLPISGEARERLAIAFELGRRAYAAPTPVLASPADVYEWCADLRTADRERFVALYLDARHRVVRRRLVSVGTLTASLVHPREVLGPALRARAAALVVVHNHPSGDPEPSPEDCALTERLRDAARLLGLELLDHVVVGRNGFVSLRERGVL